MARIVRLNRGTTLGTINLQDGVNYDVLDNWTPRIAKRRPQPVNGLLYYDVEESIPLEIKGTTVAACLGAIQDLIATLEQAYAWYEGAEVDPVLLEYLPDGTSLGAVVQAPVLGSPEAVNNLLQQAENGLWMIEHGKQTVLELPILRRGLWLGAAETPGASSTVVNPAPQSVTFAASAELPSPTKLVFSDESSPGAGGIPEHLGFVFWADVADKIQILDSSAMSTWQSLGIWTTQTTAAALGGNFRRLDVSTYTFGDTMGIGGSVSSMNADARLFAVYVSIRNISTTVTWTAKAVLAGGAYSEGPTKGLPVGAGALPDVWPQLKFMGVIATYDELQDVYILVEATGIVPTTDDIEIDYILVIALDENTGAVSWSDEDQGDYGYSHDLDLTTLDPRSLTRPTPDIYHAGGGPFAWYKGSLVVNSVGTNLTAVIAGTSDVSGDWRLETSGSVVMSFSMTATRRLGYLFVP